MPTPAPARLRGRLCAVLVGIATALMVHAPASAQGAMAQCRADQPAAAAARLRLCEAHGGCRAVARIIDSCPALNAFLALLANNGSQVDDSVLRRTLVEAGVPANGLASCMGDFNRALCRNFLHLEDASGETGAGPSRTAQFQETLRRLQDQQGRADEHRLAEGRLEACAAARLGPERETVCREAAEAVQACEVARQQWAQRREVLMVEAQRLALATELKNLRTLELPPCATTLPGGTMTPLQALVATAEPGDGSPPGSAAPPPARTPSAAPAPSPAPAPPARGEANGGAGAAAGSECKPALRRMEERFEQLQRRRPAQADRLAVQQMEIYMLTEQMGVLERLCRGQREFEFLRTTQESLARALQTCRSTAANPVNDCVPRAAW